MRDDAANANESARVSKDEDGLVRPHASRRRAIARRTTRVNALKARLLSMRAGEGGGSASNSGVMGARRVAGRANLRVRSTPRHCFRIVIYNENRNAGV
jgi:hypothetical protein